MRGTISGVLSICALYACNGSATRANVDAASAESADAALILSADASLDSSVPPVDGAVVSVDAAELPVDAQGVDARTPDAAIPVDAKRRPRSIECFCTDNGMTLGDCGAWCDDGTANDRCVYLCGTWGSDGYLTDCGGYCL